MWKARIFYGVLFTIVGIVNARFHTILNTAAAIMMFLLAAQAFNLAQEEYKQEKEEKND